MDWVKVLRFITASQSGFECRHDLNPFLGRKNSREDRHAKAADWIVGVDSGKVLSSNLPGHVASLLLAS